MKPVKKWPWGNANGSSSPSGSVSSEASSSSRAILSSSSSPVVEKKQRSAVLQFLLSGIRGKNVSHASSAPPKVDTELFPDMIPSSLESQTRATLMKSNTSGTTATSGRSSDESFSVGGSPCRTKDPRARGRDGVISPELRLGMTRASEIDEHVQEHVKFRFEPNIETIYKVGKAVIPDGEGDGMKRRRGVMYAKDLTTDEIVILKYRRKTSGSDSEQWLSMMKFLYYVTTDKTTVSNFEISSTEYPASTCLNSSHEFFKTDHLARVLDLLEDLNYYYVVMEHVEGRDLFDYFGQERLHLHPEKEAIMRNFCYEMLVSLQELGDLGLAHRDIKLENVVIIEDNQEALAKKDYGFEYTKKQKQLKSLKETMGTPSSSSTLEAGPLLKLIDYDTIEIYKPERRAYHVMGTDQYIAPESYDGYPCPASDMWALGSLMYTTLTGTFPFHHGIFDDEKSQNYVGHEKMAAIWRRLQHARIDWGGNKVWKTSPSAKSFVRSCLLFNTWDRLNVSEGLKRPWIVDRPPFPLINKDMGFGPWTN